MQATLRLLETTDPKKLRIADIAGEADVSQVTIYNYYGSKDVLVREVIMDYIRLKIREFEEFLADSHTLKEKIEYIIFQKKQSSKTFGLKVIKQIWQTDPELARFVREEYMAKGIPLVIRLIEDGKRNGEITEMLSTSTIIMYMQMLTNQADTMLDHAEQHGNMDALIEEMVHLFFYGIGTVPQPPVVS
ncbi:TetR/AcrR family transcriptional regulator [Paenibacillus planticolens]|nr:TetR/AcrR family transcriptional regulator [Paenibacillus planticolens]